MNAIPTSGKSSLSDDFVMVSNSPPSSPPISSSSVEVLKESLNPTETSEQASNDLHTRTPSENPKDNEILEKFVALAKENEELRETLKHNTTTLQVSLNVTCERRLFSLSL